MGISGKPATVLANIAQIRCRCPAGADAIHPLLPDHTGLTDKTGRNFDLADHCVPYVRSQAVPPVPLRVGDGRSRDGSRHGPGGDQVSC